MYGNTPVPWTVSWSSEDAISIAPCPHAEGRLALVQASCPGEGAPRFGSPHWIRQRECIARDLCDLCGRPLKNRTKVSLSHARPRANGAEGFDILQVEPLLHKECALVSMRYCPSLRRDIKNGTLHIRHVTRHRVQLAILDGTFCKAVAGQAVNAVGHAKVELLKWLDRDLAWLEAP